MSIEKERVNKVLEKARTMLHGDGGDIELVDVTDQGVVRVRLKGACSGCPMATMTMKSLVERILKHEIPEIASVQEVR